MGEDTAFLQAIAEDPEDDGLRLIYADWLEEQGDPRGEFLRLECALTQLRDDEKRYAEVEARLTAVRRAVDWSWSVCVGKKYDVCIERYLPQWKLKLIANVRLATGLGLRESVELVNSVPCVVGSALHWFQAEEMKEKLLQRPDPRTAPLWLVGPTEVIRVRVVIHLG